MMLSKSLICALLLNIGLGILNLCQAEMVFDHSISNVKLPSDNYILVDMYSNNQGEIKISLYDGGFGIINSVDGKWHMGIMLTDRGNGYLVKIYQLNSPEHFADTKPNNAKEVLSFDINSGFTKEFTFGEEKFLIKISGSSSMPQSLAGGSFCWLSCAHSVGVHCNGARSAWCVIQ